MQESPNVVADMARNHIGRSMKMIVYNSRSDITREVSIIPNNNWGGKTLLGDLLCLCLQSIYRCFQVRALDFANTRVPMTEYGISLASIQTRLQPQQVSLLEKVSLRRNASILSSVIDWIIGSPEITIASQDDFYNLMIHNTNKPVRLIVYNIETDSCREAVVTPSFEWGGEGW